jgi:hypothetical protein
MKSSRTSFYGFKLTLLGLFFAGLACWMPSQVQAQSAILSTGFYDAPAGPYTTAAIAQSRLESQILLMKSQFESLSQGSQAYKNLTAKYNFYTIIRDELAAGKTVQESIILGLKLFTTDSAADLPKGKKEEFKESVLALLKP